MAMRVAERKCQVLWANWTNVNERVDAIYVDDELMINRCSPKIL